jgi:hypothetical protein
MLIQYALAGKEEDKVILPYLTIFVAETDVGNEKGPTCPDIGINARKPMTTTKYVNSTRLFLLDIILLYPC